MTMSMTIMMVMTIMMIPYQSHRTKSPRNFLSRSLMCSDGSRRKAPPKPKPKNRTGMPRRRICRRPMGTTGVAPTMYSTLHICIYRLFAVATRTGPEEMEGIRAHVQLAPPLRPSPPTLPFPLPSSAPRVMMPILVFPLIPASLTTPGVYKALASADSHSPPTHLSYSCPAFNNPSHPPNLPRLSILNNLGCPNLAAQVPTLAQPNCVM